MFELRKLNVHRIVATEEEKTELISHGYEEVTREEFLEEIELTAEQIDLAARCEALKLDLPNDSTIEQVRDAVEKAERVNQEAKGKA